MNSTGKILTALAAGVAVGALLGVLFAPDKGTETRKKINDQGKKLADDLKEKLNKGKNDLNDLKEEISHTVKEKVQEFTKQGQGMFRNVVD
jgi:gas vesicle protein